MKFHLALDEISFGFGPLIEQWKVNINHCRTGLLDTISTITVMQLCLILMISLQFFPLLLKLIAWNGEK